MKKYEKYKDSGIEWLGEIPEHWSLRNLEVVARKDRYSITGGPFGSDLKNGEYTEKGVRIIQLQNIGVGEFRNDYKIFTSEDKANQLSSCNIFPGEIIIAKMADPVARACIIPDFDERYIMASDGIRLEVDNELFDVRFIEYSINSKYFNFQAELNSTGTTRLRIGLSTLKKLKIILPSLVEQHQIANFINHQTSIIDHLISEKESLISKLQEKRKSLINEVVTKGLNPNAPMRDSGIEWLGMIPEHWGISKIKYLADLKSGTNLTSEVIEPVGNFPVYGGNGLRGFYGSYTDDGHYILIGRQGALCGNINYAKGQFWATEHAVVCYPKTDLKTIWFGELLRTMNLNQYSIASAQPGLAVERIKNLAIPFPSTKEQADIVDFIESRTTKIDQTISETQLQIQKLKEYKTAVISEVVTGKVDVRDWKAST